MAIERNTFIEEITAILEGKGVSGTKREIIEVKNANLLYEYLLIYKTYDLKSCQKAHYVLMKDLLESAGFWCNS